MYFTIYKTTNKINGKYYIGKHQTKDLNDGYMGSGKLLLQAIQKYGKENFVKVVLFIFDNEEEMNLKEKELVVISEQSYNLCDGGNGGFGYINKSNITKFKGKKHTDESKKLMGHPGNKAFLGRKHSEETKRKIGEKSKTRFLGKKLSEDHKRKISESLKRKHADVV